LTITGSGKIETIVNYLFQNFGFIFTTFKKFSKKWKSEF